MTVDGWREFLQRWSDEWLATDEKFPPRVRKRRWLGTRPATAKEVARLERRLGYELPPSYRNFLLTTNGWSRTSMFIERVRPASKVRWLQIDDPQLLDVWAPEGVYEPEDCSSAEYLSYDGRPIFDRGHFRRSLVIADPVAGDTTIYVLNPLVVAEDGEWEAWRFSNWIPGAERFPSFELLMRAEHAMLPNNGDPQSFFGPYTGTYAPDQPRHAAPRIGPGRPMPRRLTIPELIVQLESPARATRASAADQLLREFRPHDPADEHPEIVGPLGRILRSGLETDVRSAAAAMLGSYGDAGAIEPLVNALDDPALAGMALGALFYLSLYMRDDRMADAMVRLLETPRSLYDTQHAVHILEQLRDPRVADIGLRLLDQAPVILPTGDGIDAPLAEAHHRSSVRSLGASAFAKFATAAADELVRRLSHEDAEIRATAVMALRLDPNKGPHLVPYVTPLLEDPDPAVQQQASATLRSLDPLPHVEISPEQYERVHASAMAQLQRSSRRKSRF